MSGAAPPSGAEGYEEGRMSADVVYDLHHEVGAPCAVVDLLCETFGEQVGVYLLWEFTCFPNDDATAWEQAKELVRADCEGRFQEHVDRLREEQERSMREAAGLERTTGQKEGADVGAGSRDR